MDESSQKRSYEKQIDEEAYKIWRLAFAHQQLHAERILNPIYTGGLRPWVAEEKSLLRLTRQILMITRDSLASNLGVNASVLTRFEQRELSGRITLSRLNEIVQAMDCELCLVIRPKNKKSFCQILWEKVLPEAKKDRIYNYNIKIKRPIRNAATHLAHVVNRCCFDKEVMEKLCISRNKGAEVKRPARI